MTDEQHEFTDLEMLTGVYNVVVAERDRLRAVVLGVRECDACQPCQRLAEVALDGSPAMGEAPPDVYGRTMSDAADAGITYGGTFKQADGATNSPLGGTSDTGELPEPTEAIDGYHRTLDPPP